VHLLRAIGRRWASGCACRGQRWAAQYRPASIRDPPDPPFGPAGSPV